MPQINPEKIVIDLPFIAYDWELPYIVGLSNANLLSLEAAQHD